MPLITKLVLEALGLHREISTFGFVYGTFPTAPSVFVFAALFHCGTTLVCCVMCMYFNKYIILYVVQLGVSAVFVQIGPALVFCTFLSAPIIYISARMALLRNVNSRDYHNVITDTRTDCSTVSIVSLVRKHDS